MEFNHKPVLFRETIEALHIRPDGLYIDGTMGGGGHSEAILQRLAGGRLLSIDQDPDAIAAGGERLAKYPQSTVIRGNFAQMKELAQEHGIEAADGILLDIGVSSHQLDAPERGFSYHHDAPLDMRMSQAGLSARDLVNTLPQEELARIIARYGEDRSAGRIAAGICKAREQGEIATTLQLAEIIKDSVPAAVRRAEGHPARRTFQALRIAVNGELDRLREGLESAFVLLAPKGRLAVITFHSLEDRMVKREMARWCQGCTCPPDFPVCVCGKKPQGRLVYKKGLSPSAEELLENPRARSARLRVFEKNGQ
ncbi:16S rRNA (cytosine(1402)-N(4))-methyltransferase RsmH [Neglecta sp. X4]|uniref:16S rRNA (cytosine(1402)-N(4))-methyltransferase RsmH n=1 Tax=unclassified Neglectibacter TaxID=2632164 RepID=UPI0013712CCF|nr:MULTISPECIES: 16S rRNA (cytosine(1402)-N(4))-methyltransferase RsmH [unclassified Neglectibacter]NBI16089.1 16S rRNA (cytosine(1402)-N(4))-methyltransferase RsmH [Neglectibacter sp. 59]NBJ71786.1 16S rRNA (cytosine(1402)-N(4))-methyltransferase RsmH [Neglectibacter sp. X4]NCE79563.1 16S rRNA (cytosine(1402)-N(4))-methyltransferase RsmH [Neglectibacter sp. X58]